MHRNDDADEDEQYRVNISTTLWSSSVGPLRNGYGDVDVTSGGDLVDGTALFRKEYEEDGQADEYEQQGWVQG